jgi:hypothetical protein
MRIFPCIFLMSIILLSCNSNPKRNNSSFSKELDNKVLIDSLVINGVSNYDERLIMGDLKNLDIINGFRKLKFNTKFESINFKDSGIDNKYKSKNIIIVMVKGVDISFFGEGDDLELTFYNDKLSRITILNGRINPSSSDLMGKFNTQIDDLIRLFGEPTSRITDFHAMEDIIPDIQNNEEEVEWSTNNVKMRFHRTWTLYTGSFIPVLRGEYSQIYYSLIGNEKIITESLQFVDDSLNMVEKK